MENKKAQILKVVSSIIILIILLMGILLISAGEVVLDGKTLNYSSDKLNVQIKDKDGNSVCI